MYKRIVVGTDGSPSANQAVTHAAELASSMGAELHVVHAYKVPDASAAASQGMLQVDPNELRQGALEHAASVCEAAVQTISGVGASVHSHIVSGEAAEAIIGTAEAVDADLIVVGNRGMSGVKRFLLGSVPNRVAHHSPCHVTILRTT